MEKEKWYLKLQKQCPKCKEYNCFFLRKKSKNFSWKKCGICGFSKKHKRSWGIYKHKGNKRFLKMDDWTKFYEVELVRNKYNELQIVKVGDNYT